MKLKLSPQRSDETVTYKRDGDNFIIDDNDPIDLSGEWEKLEPDTEGEPLESTGYLQSGVQENGEIVLTVRAPHKANAPESERFPEPVTLNDGESITFPREV